MDYIKALEEERKKILVFERELPLSLQLVTQAIETCKKKQQQQQERSEEISSEEPILEEFFSLRPSCSSSNEENINRNGNSNGLDKKPDWLRSVQLWNQQPDPKGIKDVVRKPIAVNAKRIGGAFHPFEREKIAAKAAPVAEAPSSSTTENTNGGGGGSGGSGEEKVDREKEGHSSQRKSRRCWSPELHRRFLHALQQLGGSHVATPKQIRELMKVDELTNDEVKSHLQKYRLHTRRPTTPAVQSGGSTPQQPQIVLVGGIWMPPPEYTAAAAAAAAAQPSANTTGARLNGVYAPVASVPPEFGKQKIDRSPTGPLKSERRSEGDNNSSDAERMNSDSSETSSSSQTTTASPHTMVL